MKLWKGAKDYGASTVVLVAANLIPLVGVFAWGWSAFNIVALYWVENLIVGVINILKMATCNPDPQQIDLLNMVRAKVKAARSSAISSGGGGGESQYDAEQLARQMEQFEKHSGKLGWANHVAKLFLIPFFTVHYGIFCMVHGVFVVVLLGGGGPFSKGGHSGGSPLEGGTELISRVLEGGGLWFVLAMFGSHLFSFFVNYIGKGEYRRTLLPVLMFAPYPRIVALHIAILFGAFAIALFGSPLFLLILLIVGKIGIDLGLHLRSHNKLNPEAEIAGREMVGS